MHVLNGLVGLNHISLLGVTYRTPKWLKLNYLGQPYHIPEHTLTCLLMVLAACRL